MALDRYRQKRDFTITPEPRGRVRKGRPAQRSFLVQKHAASHLHYDFRLELNGVLLSWAVPKGPSLDPNDKRLAMHVEDHPMEYGDFEGVIPPKQYGAGTVMLWDRGVWMPKGDPQEMYEKGRLKFDLEGEKLHGGWNLVRSRSGKYGGDKSWLLIKESDDHARLGADASIVEEKARSVVSGRTLEEVARDADRTWHSNRSVAANVRGGAVGGGKKITGLDALEGARKRALPDMVQPQLATLVKTPPVGDGWVHEIKYDGYRMLCRIDKGKAHVISRTGKDWTGAFAAIAHAAARLPLTSAWIDGEIVALDENGRSSFQQLQNALSGALSDSLVYFVFDLLDLDGHDLTALSLEARKSVLRRLVENAPATIRFSEHFAVPGGEFLKNVCALGLEGMMSKRADLPYQPQRGTAWQKVKCLRRQEMVIGGFTDPGGSRLGFGALLLGVYDAEGRLAYSGRVGTGFDDAALLDLRPKLDALVQKEPAFHNPPRGYEAKGAHWVKPKLVAEVAFTEWTDDGTLRHPSYQGLRLDKPAQEVVREVAIAAPAEGAATGGAAPVRQKGAGKRDAPGGKSAVGGTSGSSPLVQSVPGVGPGGKRLAAANASAAGTPAQPTAAATRVKGAPSARGVASGKDAVAGIALSNPGKVLYPEAGISKRDLARYYEAVGDWILPHLRDRPLTLVRCPNGWDKPCFYQKNADASVIDAIERVEIRTSDGGTANYMMANSITAVVGLLQMGALELHPWGSRKPKLGFADRIILDLDPDDAVSWETLKEAVTVVRTLLENLGLAAFLKTTGGKGLHVVVPIDPTVPWDDVKGFTKAVAELLERTFPDRFTSKLLKVSRRGKIFIDYLRNAEGATAVAAYSLRAKAHAPVSVPIAWKELAKDLRYDHFNVSNVPKRLARLRIDPWEDMDRSSAALTPAIMARVLYEPG